MAKPVFTFKEVCALLDVAPSTFAVIVRHKPVPWFTLGRRRYVMKDDFLEWLQVERDKASPSQPTAS